MKKFFYFFLLVCPVTILTAQSLSPKVVGGGGGIAAAGTGTLSYTVGESSLISTFSAYGNTLTQGFQQPNNLINGLIDLSPESFVVYPCPAISHVWFGFELPEPGKVTMMLFNGLDQKVMEPYQMNYRGGKIVEQMDVAKLPSGIYFLAIQFTGDADGKKMQLSRKLEVIK